MSIVLDTTVLIDHLWGSTPTGKYIAEILRAPY